MPASTIPEKWRWFNDARFGLFIHWGVYSRYGRGEQVLFREHLDQREYAQQAVAGSRNTSTPLPGRTWQNALVSATRCLPPVIMMDSVCGTRR